MADDTLDFVPNSDFVLHDLSYITTGNPAIETL